MTPHKEFLRRLARRRARDPRARIFTTNYDLCFERSANAIGLVALDGFSFSGTRRFDPRHFEYDIVRRSSSSGDGPHFVSGVFHLLKLHDSVDWAMERGEIVVDPTVDASRACLVYPTREKYRFSYQQPHLELMAQFLAAVRLPNTCLLIAGFGFNDDHLSAPIFAALESNPHMRVIVASPGVKSSLAEPPNASWERIRALVETGADLGLVAATFSQLAVLVPDLRALSPGEQLERAVKGVLTGRE